MNRRRALVLLVLVVATLAALGVATVAFLPELARRLAESRLRALTGRAVSIERVDIELVDGRLRLHGLHVADRDAGTTLARVRRVEVRVRHRAILEGRLHADELAVDGWQAHIVRLPGNRFNISDLLEAPAETPGRFPVLIEHLRIRDGVLTLEDRALSPSRTWTAERIVLEATGLSTLGADARASLSTIIAGAPVHARLDDLGLVPLRLRAHITVGNVDLGLLRLYLPADAPVLPDGGVLAAGITVVHAEAGRTRITAGARIRQLTLVRHGQPGMFASSPEVTIALNDLELQGGAFALSRAEVDGDLTIVEALRAPALPYTFTRTRLVVENLAWPAVRTGRVRYTATLPGGGQLQIDSSVRAAPLQAEGTVRVTGADLDLANRYLELGGRIGGSIDAQARLQATLGDTPTLHVTAAVGARRLTLADPAGQPPAPPLGVERLDASGIEYRWPGQLKVGFAHLRGPWAVVARDAAGAVDLAQLFARTTPPSDAPETGATARPLELTVDDLRVEHGRLVFTDGTMAPAARHELTDLAAEIRGLNWPPRGDTSVRVTTRLAGGGLVAATGAVALERRRARLRVTAADLELAALQPYLPFEALVSGRAAADLETRIRLEPLGVRARGSVALTEAVVVHRDRPLLAVERVDLAGVDYRWPRQVVIDQLTVRRPWAKIDRDERGQLSLRAAFVQRSGGQSRVGPAAAAGQSPRLEVRRAIFEEGATSVIDTSVEPAARFEIRGSRLEIRNFTWPVRLPAEVAIATPMPGGGRLQGRGTFQVDPDRLDLRVTMTGVPIEPAQPYVPFAARVAGTLDSTVRISGRFDPLALDIRGDATLTDLTLGDENRALLSAGRARVTGVRVRWPGGIRVEALELERPWALVERDPSGRFPLVDRFLLRGPRAPGRAAGPATPSAPLRVEVGSLTITDGFGRFVDRTVAPPFAEELAAIDLALTGIDTTPGARVRVALRATLGPTAPLAINGEFTLPGAPTRMDVLFTLGGYQAPRANAYLRTLFGWTARQGRLTLAAHYVVDGDDLRASNSLGASGLELVPAPGDTPAKWPISLPLDLFVSLLKDTADDLQLTLPISGRLSAPDFELGDAMWSALRNLAIKTVALPFSLIGRLLFTPDSRIESLQVNPVMFEPGTTALAAGMSTHLDHLARFLRERPVIQLRLRPILSVQDVARLKREALRERVQAEAGERRRDAMRAALARMYAERLPQRPPASVEEMIAALAEFDPPPTAASTGLAARRLEAVRSALGQRGVDGARLSVIAAAVSVESDGAGRVEFEITD